MTTGHNEVREQTWESLKSIFGVGNNVQTISYRKIISNVYHSLMMVINRCGTYNHQCTSLLLEQKNVLALQCIGQDAVITPTCIIAHNHLG